MARVGVTKKENYIRGVTHPLYLRNILHVPHVSKDLLSVHKLTSDNDAIAEFHPDRF